MLGLNVFSFADLWSPLFLAAVLVAVSGYFMLVGPLADRFGMAAPAAPRQRIFFVTGMATLYLAQGGPVSLMGHLMFSLHMLSMALSYYVAVPLIMLSIPAELWRTLLRVNPFRRLAFLAHPVTAALLFNGLFSLYHIPAVHDYVMLHFGVHRLYYAVLFAASALMWWTLINPLPERDRWNGLAKVGFIFLNMVLLTPACGLIILPISRFMRRTATRMPGPERWATAFRATPPRCCGLLADRPSLK